jgi:tetratricopeptide (TPR) repeat protein
VLVHAQLGVANDIAWGFWQQKEKVVPKWLVAAHEVAEDLIDQEGADEMLHLLVLRRALAASAGTQGKLDPVMWTKEAVKTARRMIDTSDDPWRRGRLEWELGVALYDALQADQARGYHDHALSNSSLVVKYLEAASKQRQETPQGAYLLGRLYFRVGAIHAVELNDHRTAVAWFQKALPLLERPQPTTALADVGRLGESFVSIGISYWETGRRDEAIRLTQHGIALVSQGIKDRAMEEDALVVPYSNLAFMHRELGNVKQAENYSEMATRLDGTRRQ